MQPLRRRLGRALLPCAAFIAVAMLTQHAQAQLSSAQQSALRANCRSDFMSHCSGVTPGSKGALTCLQKNVASLSPGCKSAVSATLPPPPKPAAAAPKPKPAAAAPPRPKPATAAAPPPRQVTAAQKDAMRASCRGDFMSHCSGVSPGGPEALACLQRNVSRLSGACRQVIGSTMAPASRQQPKQTVRTAPAPAAAPPPKPAPRQVTAAQKDAMRASCRGDFMSHCSGVSPGGPEALACLQRNVSRLSGACRQVIGSTMGPASRQQPQQAVAAPPGAGPTPQQMKALKFTCRRDFRAHCRGVWGGQAAFACLARNAGRLTPNCRTSVADIRRSMPAMPPPAAAGAPMPVAPPPAAPPPSRATVVDAAVMLRACKRDMIRYCRGTHLGGGRMLGCLMAHKASLGFRCKIALKVTSPLR